MNEKNETTEMRGTVLEQVRRFQLSDVEFAALTGMSLATAAGFLQGRFSPGKNVTLKLLRFIERAKGAASRADLRLP